MTDLACGQEPGKIVNFGGADIPTPPQQKVSWTAPATQLPEKFVTATARLFEYGLADPRGCEYRELEVVAGSVWGGAGVNKTHGWVLPPRSNDGQRFAVCWNGLVYPVVTVGDRADLRQDMLVLIKADEDMRTLQAKERPELPFTRYEHAVPEAHSLSQTTLLPLKACLLLRLGEKELAEKLWTTYTAGMPGNVNNNSSNLDDPYLMLASDWTWSLFDRAVCAHMRGDDRLALLSARALMPIQQAVEAEAENRGLKRPYRSTAPGQKVSYLDFLAPLPALLADQERRDKEPKRDAAISVDVSTLPQKSERIAVLIQNLDAVAARQWGQPGGVSLGEDRIVQSLIKQGDDAVEPLLEVVENDTRLTRSVHFHRDFFRSRSIIGVHEAAYIALAGILKTNFFGVGATGDDLTAHGLEGRRVVAARIREYWNQFKGVPLEERWCRTLENDRASTDEWLQAASNIVQPVDVEVTPASMFGGGWVSVPHREPGEMPKVRGEVLRSHRNPSVAELLAQRVQTITNRAGEPDMAASSRGAWELRKAAEMTLDLARWDIVTALPVLQKQVARIRDELAKPNDNANKWSTLGLYIPKLTRERVRGNDAQALADYAAWVRTLPAVSDLNTQIEKVFEPLWRYADQPVMSETSEWLFNDKASPWNPLLQPRQNGWPWDVMDLLETPLIGLPAFRRQILRELENKSKAGTIKVRSQGSVNINVDLGWNTGTGIDQTDPLAPPAGAEQSFRVCDLYASHLSRLEGTPPVQLYWLEAERDKAVAVCAQFLRQYGARFAYSAQQQALQDDPFESKARLTLPPLRQPATVEDVKQGRAIFALDNKDRVRLYRLPQVPLKAKWVTLRKYPRSVQTSDQSGKTSTKTDYQQNGLVWQAEEILKNGKWQRFYGFVGPFGIDKVAAEEIEFPAGDQNSWSPLSRGLEARLYPPGIERGKVMSSIPPRKIGDPLIASLWLRNRSGIEQAVPSVYYRSPPKGSPALLSGTAIELYYSPSRNADGKYIKEEERQWEAVVPTTTAHFKITDSAKVVSPTQEYQAFQIDLRDWFKVTHPGWYRISCTFTLQNSGFAEGKTKSEQFVVIDDKIDRNS